MRSQHLSGNDFYFHHLISVDEGGMCPRHDLYMHGKEDVCNVYYWSVNMWWPREIEYQQNTEYPYDNTITAQKIPNST
jgi:hypothetical protein